MCKFAIGSLSWTEIYSWLLHFDQQILGFITRDFVPKRYFLSTSFHRLPSTLLEHYLVRSHFTYFSFFWKSGNELLTGRIHCAPRVQKDAMREACDSTPFSPLMIPVAGQFNTFDIWHHLHDYEHLRIHEIDAQPQLFHSHYTHISPW